MNRELAVGTRKGLFFLAPDRDGWRIRERCFLGDPVGQVLEDPLSGALFAGLDLGHFGSKLRRSDDGGRNWRELAVPALPEKPEGHEDSTPWSVEKLWCLETGGCERPGVLWCGTIPGALFRSDDAGESWSLNEPLWQEPSRSQWFGGGYDHPGIHSICVDPRDGDNVTVAVSCGGVWQTRDGGGSWTVRGEGLRADYMPEALQTDPTIQDPHRLVRCASSPDDLWMQHHNGIWRSTDDCTSWQEITGVAPSTFGFAAAVDPDDPDRAWFVPAKKDEHRIPVDGAMVVNRTDDGGRTFTALRRGLPQEDAYDLVYRHALDTAGGGLLALGSTSGSLWISDDGGERFEHVSAHLPPIYCVRFLGG